MAARRFAPSIDFSRHVRVNADHVPEFPGSIYMHFVIRDGCYCQFLEEDLKTPLPKKLNFADISNVRELTEKGRGFANLEGRHALDHAVEVGRGRIFLQLTEEQYAK